MPMVTRYKIMDASGLCWTGFEDEFSYDPDQAVQYRDLDEAVEDAAQFPGVTVERFQRYSSIADPIHIANRRVAA